jgi:hypothetical protein
MTRLLHTVAIKPGSDPVGTRSVDGLFDDFRHADCRSHVKATWFASARSWDVPDRELTQTTAATAPSTCSSAAHVRALAQCWTTALVCSAVNLATASSTPVGGINKCCIASTGSSCHSWMITRDRRRQKAPSCHANQYQ